MLQSFSLEKRQDKTHALFTGISRQFMVSALKFKNFFVGQLFLEGVQHSTWWLRVVGVSDMFLTLWHSAALCHVHAAVLTQKANTSKPGRRGTAHALLVWGTEAEEEPTQSHRKAVQQQGTYILT